jgi:DUF971 family protein
MKAVPVKIKAPHGAQVMQIEWSDGHLGVYPHDVLRGMCPCAMCQGHSRPVQYRSGGNLELREITAVGNYALAMKWGDGHATGIYNFDYLRTLCRCEACKSVEPAQGS